MYIPPKPSRALFAPKFREHMGWPIKEAALKKWNEDAPKWPIRGPSEFDPMPAFETLDDFLFLGPLRDTIEVFWVGSYETEPSIKGRVATAIGLTKVHNKARMARTEIQLQCRTKYGTHHLIV